MSNIYNQEPPTSGRVILHTTCGDIEVELWAKQCPKASRNFIQLCLEGYYDGIIFHRIVPDFIAQTGDPTGTGVGGESVYGEPFPDEVHSRLRYNRRGLVGMATAARNENTSQFFFTLTATEELQGKNTLFGRVVGDTIYNLVKIGETPCDGNGRPLTPPKIKGAAVVENPFTDIVPRPKAAPVTVPSQGDKPKEKRVKKKKNTAMLSFGEEAEEEEIAVKKAGKGRMKSSHDLLKNDPQLQHATVAPPEAPVVAAPTVALSNKTITDPGEEGRIILPNEEYTKEIEDIMAARAREATPQPSRKPTVEDEIERVKAQLRSMDNKGKVKGVEKSAPLPPVRSALSEMRKEMSLSTVSGDRKSRKKKEEETFARLEAFTSKMWASTGSSAREVRKRKARSEEQGPLCALHSVPNCESCNRSKERSRSQSTGKSEAVPENQAGLEEEEDFTLSDEDRGSGWLSHELSFAKDTRGKDLMSRREDFDDYVVIDPRVREAIDKREAKAARSDRHRDDQQSRRRYHR